MFENFVKTAYRNLILHKSYTIINIAGLAIGLACTIFISIYIIHELSYDGYHENADQIYRVGVRGKFSGSEFNQAITAEPMAQAMVNDFPEILNATRVRQSGGWLVKNGDRVFNETEETFKFADSTFFDIFSIPLIKGNPKTALTKPFSLVLSENAVRKYFGDEDPMGKMLRVETDTTLFEVTGVFKSIPTNTHFHTELLGSIPSYWTGRNAFWVSHNFYTYILVEEGVSEAVLIEKLNTLIDKYVGPQVEEFLGISMDEFAESGNSFGYFVQPLKDIHLYSNLDYEMEPNGNITYVYVFAIIALFILLIACINFMNLATAKSANRSKEVGIRKLLGSNRSGLISQFLSESTFLSFLSLFIAVVIVFVLFPYFNNLISLRLSFNLFTNLYTLPLLILLVILVGSLAGSYPAFFLASFKPVSVLKGKIREGVKNGWLRSGLVILQFLVSIIIFFGTFTIYKQLKYFQNKELGFNKENILIIKRSDALKDKMETFKQELSKSPGVISVANSNGIPGRNFDNNVFFLEGRSMSETDLMWQTSVSPEFGETYNLKMAEGRFFSRNISTDSTGIIINEAAVKALKIADPVGKRFFFPNGNGQPPNYIPIVGVVKDFHFQSLHNNIQPMALSFMRGNFEGYVSVKVHKENVNKTISVVESMWHEYAGDYPFEYTFLDDELDNLYKDEKRTGKLFVIFSILSIFISCLGLFGLVSYSSEQRTREIGIRKTFGSSVQNIIVLLSKEIVLLVFIAVLIALPLGWYIMVKYFLQDFAFRINIGPGIFIITTFLAFLVALVTTSIQSVKAALKNPVTALKYE